MDTNKDWHYREKTKPLHSKSKKILMPLMDLKKITYKYYKCVITFEPIILPEKVITHKKKKNDLKHTYSSFHLESKMEFSFTVFI